MYKRAADTYSLNDSLGFLVNNASRAIRRRLNQDLVHHGYDIGGEEFGLLAHLWSQDGRHQKDLAEALGKDKTTMTRLINVVEGKGLVERVTDEDDERHKRVFLTERGRAEMVGLLEVAVEILDEAAEGVDPADMEICKRVLRQVAESLGNARYERREA